MKLKSIQIQQYPDKSVQQPTSRIQIQTKFNNQTLNNISSVRLQNQPTILQTPIPKKSLNQTKNKSSFFSSIKIFKLCIIISIFIFLIVVGQVYWYSLKYTQSIRLNQAIEAAEDNKVQQENNQTSKNQLFQQQNKTKIAQTILQVKQAQQEKNIQIQKFSNQKKNETLQQKKSIINIIQQQSQKKINKDNTDNLKAKFVENYNLNLTEAMQIQNIWKVTTPKQLPFCILIAAGQETSSKQIQDSINQQKYSNYEIIAVRKNNNKHPQAIKDNNIYKRYKQRIQLECARNTIILIINKPLKQDNILSQLNDVHQRYNTWVTYLSELNNDNNNNQKIQVLSFYWRIFDLLENNDFEGHSSKYLNQGNYEVMALGVLELCQLFSKNISKIDTNINRDINISPLRANLRGPNLFLRNPYTKLYKLSQDFLVNIGTEQERYKRLSQIKNQPFNSMTPEKMFKAIQRQQLPYLPLNHSITQIQQIQYTAMFKNLPKKISQKQLSPETKFCVTILSHNNIDQNRYKKVLLSLYQQQYENYRVIFIDDNSTDKNTQYSIKYAKQLGFFNQKSNQTGNVPKMIFIQNKKRMYATYNFINAAFNYCQADQVQLLLDGDDELIGRYALKTMDGAYRRANITKQQRWIVYSNFKSNMFTYGTSQYLRSINQLVRNGKRNSNHFIGPIRTWRVQLLYNIPLSYHKNSTGHWFDTVYDDAIQHSIVQLSGIPRIEYLPQILYEYNKQYGDNDDATQQKRQHRRQTYQGILALKPLKQLQKLSQSIKNQQVVRELQRDRGVDFEVIQQW